MLPRCDAAARPYWRQDWQHDFGGFTKFYEYEKNGKSKTRYLVAYILRPTTSEMDACLCFLLVSEVPKAKP